MQSITVQSPGRINIIGEHTDYNEGYVLPAAIDMGTQFSIKKNGTAGEINVCAKHVSESFRFNLNKIESTIISGWENYIIGVVAEIKKLSPKIKGFDAEFDGNLPIGSGLSSSASLECSLAYGLNVLFDLQLNSWQLIKLCQTAEHHYVGIQCGIMDQFASVMGKKDHVMLLDCRSLAYKYFPLDLESYQLILINSHVSHSLATSAYNTRRSECEEAVNQMKKIHKNIHTLRDVSMSMLEESSDLLSTDLYKRSKHVITENMRVLSATKALSKKDYKNLGALMYQSHDSLQHDYEVSCVELDFLVDFTRDKDYILGSRMMGGGFGGCSINLIEKSKIGAFKIEITEAFGEQFSSTVSPYEVNIEDGAGKIE